MVNKESINEALQQMTGFRVGRWGASPTELVSSMGLTITEWRHIKKNEDSGHLDKDDIKEINKYFKNGGEY